MLGALGASAQSADPVLEAALDRLRSRPGLAASDLAALRVVDRVPSRHDGVVHLHLRQQIGGIEVHGAEAAVTVDATGRSWLGGERLLRGLGTSATVPVPALSPEEALDAAARALDLPAPLAATLLTPQTGAERAARYQGGGLSRDPIPVRLAFVAGPDGGAPTLCWNLVVRTPDGRHWWNLYVDAGTGELVRRDDWIARESYRVHPLPLASPDEGPRELLVDPADPTASPFGWHDTDGAAGAESTLTTGNNVEAQDDIDANDAGGVQPDGGAGLDFDFPLDLDTQPGNYLDASVTHLFALNNVIHDVLYQYGFDEASGNFQQNNYGRGGLGGDPVQADTQDGFDTNNAQFGTPPDGFDPRMEMFRWTQSPAPHLLVSAPPVIAGTYLANGALFGGGTMPSGLSGTLVQALDPADAAGPSTTDACSPLSNAVDVSGNLALIDRGICTFVVKVGHAQAAGAIGVVIANNDGDGLVTMAGVDPSLTIPAIFVGQSDGATLASQTGAGVSAQLTSIAARDSSLDAGVVVHEYGHGISNRLTGGPSTVSCLDAAESAGMGEGYGDWLALVFTAMESDQAEDARGIGPYLIGQPPTGGGIRNQPYSTDPALSSLTYGDISSLNQPHGVGEVWAGALWEFYWNLVTRDGFDADLYAGSGGNNLALGLVLDGMKMQPCDPTFVSGRDALLAADSAANAGANECEIWRAFAKRGVGVAASDGGGPGTLAVTEDFEVPVHCPEPGALAMLASGVLMLAGLARRG